MPLSLGARSFKGACTRSRRDTLSRPYRAPTGHRGDAGDGTLGTDRSPLFSLFLFFFMLPQTNGDTVAAERGTGPAHADVSRRTELSVNWALLQFRRGCLRGHRNLDSSERSRDSDTVSL